MATKKPVPAPAPKVTKKQRVASVSGTVSFVYTTTKGNKISFMNYSIAAEVVSKPINRNQLLSAADGYIEKLRKVKF